MGRGWDLDAPLDQVVREKVVGNLRASGASGNARVLHLAP